MTSKFFKYKSLLLVLTGIFLILLINCSSDPPTKTSDSGKIKGTVYNAENGAAIGKALVYTTPPTSAVTTDTTTGAYEIGNVEIGRYHVTAIKAGYDSAGVNISVTGGNTTIADISLLQDTLAAEY